LAKERVVAETLEGISSEAHKAVVTVEWRFK